jgi:hypothetical protein
MLLSIFEFSQKKRKYKKIKREYLEEIQKIIAVRRECQSA